MTRTAVFGMVILGCAGAGLGALRSSEAAEPATVWTPLWQDEFVGAAGTPVDPNNWQYDLGRGYPGGPTGWGNNELQTYTSEMANVALDGNGSLRITATRTDTGEWHSARIETVRSDFAPPPGGSLKIEARLSLPKGGTGYWPAFWALGEPIRTGAMPWPKGGEIDVMENVNASSKVSGALHCGTTPGGPCREPSGRYGHRYLWGSGSPHTYAIIWDTAPKRIRWLVDGKVFLTVTAADVGEAAWSDATGHGYFLLLNVAIGGTLPGPPNNLTQAGASMRVDWVRVSTGRPA